MLDCQNCGEKWTWKQTFKRSFTFIGGMTCPYCGKIQYYSSRFKNRSSIVPFIIGVFIILMNLLFGPSYIIVVALLGFAPLFIGIYPFFAELSNEEDPLW